MRKRAVITVSACLGAAFLGLVVVAGCGGGGPTTNAGGTVASNAFMKLLPAAQRSATRVGYQKCAECHSTDKAVAAHTRAATTPTGLVADQEQTAHFKALVDCESCHGPGSVHAANPSTTNILNGVNATSSAVCAQCHAQEASDWSTSLHAQFVADPVQSGSNNCLRCHSAEFATLNVQEPLAQGQTPTQVNTTVTSLSTATLTSYEPETMTSATCTSCHDPHRNTGNLTSAGNEIYLRRAITNSDLSSDQPNASVALYTTVNHVCGSCHNNRGGDPSDAGLTKNTSRPATHEGPEYNMLLGYGGSEDTAGPPRRTATHAIAPDQCAHCHMGNSSHTFVASVTTSCAPCHSPTDAANLENTLQTQIQSDLVALRTRMANWATTTFGNANDWDYTTNIPAGITPPNQTMIPIQVKRARHNYYFILLDRSLGVHNAFYTQYLIDYANTGLDAIGISRAAKDPAITRSVAVAILNQDIAKVRAGNARATD